MLTKLQIECFRGIRSLTLNDTARVNLVVGRNDAGKTTLLESVRLLQSGDPRHLRRQNRNRYDRRVTSAETQFLLAFHQCEEANRIRVGGEFDSLRFNATAYFEELNDEEVLQLELDEPEDEVSDTLLEKGRQVVVKVEANGQLATISVPLFDGPSLIGVRRDPGLSSRRSFSHGTFPKVPHLVWLGTNRLESWAHASRYSAIYRSGEAARLLAVLHKIEPTLEELVVLTDPHETSVSSRSYAVLEARVSGQPPLPLESMGEGFVSIISIVTAIATSKGGLCLIDEVENGVHYSILPEVWTSILETALSCESQVWATTHSLDCVSAAYSAFSNAPDQLMVHRLERQDGGEIKVHTFDHEMLGRALDRGLEVR